MSGDRAAIAEFQAALLELLAEEGMDAVRARERLASEPQFEAFRDWVATFEPRMIETAIVLTRRWGRRL